MSWPSQSHAAGVTLAEERRTRQPEQLLPRRLSPRHDPAPAASEFPPSPGPRITPERRIFLGRGQGRCAGSQWLLAGGWLESPGAFRAGRRGEADSRPAGG